jgi:hypothetical protein
VSNRKQWVVELIAKMANIPYGVAEGVVDRLMEEGVLHLGYGNADVDIVVEAFTDTFGTTKVTRQDRWAASRLLKAQGGNAQSIAGVIRLLGANMGERYAPVVGSVAQLETKWVSVINFLRNLSTDSSEVIPNE